MKNISDVQRKVSEAMDSVNNISRATPKPFFYTRLEARLMRQERNFWEKMSRMVTRPTVAVVTLSLVIILNAAVVIQGLTVIDNVPDLSDMTATEDLRGATTYYDIENNQP